MPVLQQGHESGSKWYFSTLERPYISSNLACFKHVGALIFLQTTRRYMNIVPLSRLKFGYMNFYKGFFTVGNRKMVYSQSAVGGY